MIQDIDIDVTDWSMFKHINLKEDIPTVGCIYFLFNGDELVYIGQTKNLRQRMMHLNAFLNPNLYCGDKQLCENLFDNIFYRLESDKDMRKRLEKKYYDTFCPKVNFYGILSNSFLYGSHANYTKFRLVFGIEKRYEV